MEEWQNPETIARWIIIIAIFFLLLLAFIVLVIRAFFQKVVKTKLAESTAKLTYQKNLLNTTITTQEKERKRIAADLHDALIGKLTAVNLQQELNPEQNAKSIHLISECINTSRRISHNLSPPLLEFSSVSELITEVLDPWKSKFELDCLFDVRKKETHSNEFKIQLIRILQELVTNIGKHANATSIKIHFRQSEGLTALQIMDNGIGFDFTTARKGLGLKNIETRVQYLKGSYRIKSKTNEGTSTLFMFNNPVKIETI